MKLGEYLRQAEQGGGADLRPPVTQDQQLQFVVAADERAPYWDPYNLTQRSTQNAQYSSGDSVPLPYLTYTGCFVFVQPSQTIEVNPDQFLNWRYRDQIPVTAIRDFAFKNVACPIPLTVGDAAGSAGLRLDLVTRQNGNWWGVATAGTACTTTTTTTQPPCDCSTHPSMQVTVSGVSLRPGAGLCGSNDQICNQMNRTWCLPFRGKGWAWWGAATCQWEYTLTYNNGCPPGSLWYGPSTQTQARLRWPLYKIYDPATSSYVCPAELDFGVYKYTSYDFHPDTGGTFTDGNPASPWNPTCIGWPASLTVTANANCDVDPPTTTTTTTTSTTTGPPGP